ncbi:MAG: RluA family pseudouridine synthase, partial [Syntrophobacteria bacterium]
MSEHYFTVSPEDAGIRLDVFLSRTLLGLSRNQVQRLINQEYIRVDGTCQKARYLVRPGEEITVSVPGAPPAELTPEPLSLDILFEDDFLIAVNKPAGLVVHPAAGHRHGTLVHGLLHHCGRLAELGGSSRPGIVHRLDKNTSGVLVAAKNNLAYRHLTVQFKEHRIYKEYSAVVYGRLADHAGDIQAPIDRHHRNRKKMWVSAAGREAFTSWCVESTFTEVSLLKVVTRTGRTHQIRVHLAHMQHPVVGDSTYGGKKRARSVQNQLVRARLIRIKRQMLHARRLVLEHPAGG